MTRQRFAYPTNRIPHLWAHQTQESARNTGRGNLYFEGDTIYSYGSHFPIARHVEYKSKRAIFFTTRNYSVTTSGHKWAVRGAILPNVPVFYTENVHNTPPSVLAEYKSTIHQRLIELAAARNKRSIAKRYESLRHAVKAANEFCEFFGYKTRFEFPKNQNELEKLAKQEQEKQSARERAAARRKQRQYAEWKRHEEEENARLRQCLPLLIGQWRKGANPFSSIGWRYRDLVPVLLRIKGAVVETSKGAEFPIDHAVRALPIVQRLLANGQEYLRDGHSIRLGRYVIDRIDEHGRFYAGCHVVERTEVERLINSLSLNQVS